MEKITMAKLFEIMHTYNDRFPEKQDTANLSAVIVYKASNWSKPYSLEERSYKVTNNNRFFQSNKISNSLFGDCLDGKDLGVRLDVYKWDVEYCYML